MDSPASSDGQTDDHEIIATFRYTLQPGADTDELQRLWNEMYQLATAAGMLGAELSKTKDDVLLITYRFPSMRAITSFTEHPAHRAVQKRGEEFFATLHTQICMLVRESKFQPSRAATTHRCRLTPGLWHIVVRVNPSLGVAAPVCWMATPDSTDCLPFRPDIPPVGPECVSVMRRRRSLSLPFAAGVAVSHGRLP